MERATTKLASRQTEQDLHTQTQTVSKKPGNAGAKSTEPGNAEQQTLPSHGAAMDSSSTSDSFQDPPGEMQYDNSLFLSFPDIDVFNGFDPGFDLGNVDAVLQGNLDLSLPWHTE